MTNDSSTGGYLQPTSNNDLNDATLAQFLQQVVVGITGLPGNMVRPRWQVEPPNLPDFGTNWAAIGPGARKRDPFAAVIHNSSGDGSSMVVRNRLLEILCSFYGPLAETNGELLAIGFEVSQNREVMQLAGFNIIGGVDGPVIAPALIKQRWQYRADYTFTIRQQQKYTYPILNLEGVQITLQAQDGTQSITEDISVTIPTES